MLPPAVFHLSFWWLLRRETTANREAPKIRTTS